MMKKLLLFCGLMISAWASMAQAGGSIEGHVVNENSINLGGATILVQQGGITKWNGASDKYGKFVAKPLDAGTYIVTVTYKGKGDQVIDDILVSSGSATSLPKIVMSPAKTVIGGGKGFTVTGKIKKKLVDPGKPGQTAAIDSKVIEKTATTNVLDLVGLKSGVQKGKGNTFNLGGGRSGNTLYMIDGVLVRDGNRAAPIVGTTDQIQVVLGGMPANLGDATGGVIQLTTKGPSNKTMGSVNAQTSIDGYNNNQLNFNLRGPLLKKKIAGTSATRTVLGYTFAAGITRNSDDDPNFFPNRVLNNDKRAELALNPLKAVERGGQVVFVNAAEFVTADDLVTIKRRQNAGNENYSIQTKLDYAPTSTMNIVLGTVGTYGRSNNWSFGNSVFAPEANSVSEAYTGRAFLRLKQTLSTAAKKTAVEGDAAKLSVIDKAFYTVQFSYEKNRNVTQHQQHGTNFFDYGYVGKFKQYERPRYQFSTVKGYQAVVFAGNVQDSLVFTGDLNYNPNFTAYTDFVYNNIATKPRSLLGLQQLNGLLNGDAPDAVHNSGMFSNVGAGIGSYAKSELDQASVSFDASFDINTGIKRSEKLDKDVRAVHAIEFGLYYDQRTSRSYSLGARGLWTLARQLANSHISQFDTENPIWTINGKTYTLADVQAGIVTPTQFDTVSYGRLNSGSESFFSKNLRAKLGKPSTEFIYTDELDPTQLTLDMFSADDLFNSGSQYVSYFGYDHLGNRQKGRPSFEDFWTKKDENGNAARSIAPFNPIYVAGYIQDNFQFKDIRFRLGLRVDRYDANQKVLRDPYSFFPTLKVSDLAGKKYETAVDVASGSVKAPDPVANTDFFNEFKDATVYVDNNSNATPTIVGYRLGNIWYDPFGKEISTPDILNVKYTGGSKVAPYLQNKDDAQANRVQSPNFDIASSFKDYVPRLNLSPRISFSFPVDGDKSLFYAHYDVITQRPSNVFVGPDVYYFVDQTAGDIQNNGNLSPERRIDYELGFQQLLTPTSALKLSAFYIERKDQIQLQQFTAAYPNSYTTFGNRDFSTTKGVTAEVNFSPTERLPLNVLLAYTLQFADGTGSNSQSQRALLQSGQPNLRQVLPLDFDSRHNLSINGNLDLGAYNNGKGPFSIGKINPLENSSLNLTLSGRSGEPYTRLARAVSLFDGGFGNPIVGTVNGSRRPWTFNADLRFDRSFKTFQYGKKDLKGNRRQTSLNAFCFVNNLFNTRNILSVYSFTGLADDDGFLQSNIGQQFLSNLSTSRESYTDLYNLRLQDPGRLVNPRRINIGATFNF